jgi:hypothetical protein
MAVTVDRDASVRIQALEGCGVQRDREIAEFIGGLRRVEGEFDRVSATFEIVQAELSRMRAATAVR